MTGAVNVELLDRHRSVGNALGLTDAKPRQFTVPVSALISCSRFCAWAAWS